MIIIFSKLNAKRKLANLKRIIANEKEESRVLCFSATSPPFFIICQLKGILMLGNLSFEFFLPLGNSPPGNLYTSSFEMKLYFSKRETFFAQRNSIFYVLSSKSHAQKTVIWGELSSTVLAEIHSLVAVFIVSISSTYYIRFAATVGAFYHKIIYLGSIK